MHKKILALVAAFGVAACGSAWAAWPEDKPIEVIIGFAPGGGTDVMARVMGQKLSVMWNTPVTVENKAGAGGVIAAEYVAKAANDGTTLLMTNISNHAIAPALYPSLP